MKPVTVAVLVMVVLGLAPLLADEPPAPAAGLPPPPQVQLQQMELQGRQLELMSREAKMKFEKDMNDLQLEQRRIEVDRMRQGGGPGSQWTPPAHWQGHGHGGLGLLLVLCFVVHVLLTVWACQDMRRRNSVSGIWIAIVLISGLFGAAVYALVRLGDKPA